jgi:hypothetical protein
VLQVPVPEEVIQLMARTFDEEKGHDWEHFATGLGWNRRWVSLYKHMAP